MHQIKGSKITDVDEVGLDSDGICVSERGAGELPTARGELSTLKPGQGSKDKNCQVRARRGGHRCCPFTHSYRENSQFPGALLWLSPTPQQHHLTRTLLHATQVAGQVTGGVEAASLLRGIFMLCRQVSSLVCSSPWPCSSSSRSSLLPPTSNISQGSPCCKGAKGVLGAGCGHAVMNSCSAELFEGVFPGCLNGVISFYTIVSLAGPGCKQLQ